MSFTPPSTADMAMNWASKASAISRASVVLPVPGGPQRIIECSRPDSKATRSGLPGPSRCGWPITSSSVFGRSRSASGAARGVGESEVRAELGARTVRAEDAGAIDSARRRQRGIPRDIRCAIARRRPSRSCRARPSPPFPPCWSRSSRSTPAKRAGRRLEQLGLDSLALMEFVFAVEDRFDVRIPEERLDPRQAGVTLEQLARLIDEAVAGEPASDAAAA
jgi:acyl carrier protein